MGVAEDYILDMDLTTAMRTKPVQEMDSGTAPTDVS